MIHANTFLSRLKTTSQTLGKRAPSLCACVLAAFLLGACENKPQGDLGVQSDKHALQSEAYLSQGQYGAAMIEAKNAIQKAPKSLQGHIILAKIFIDLGSPSNAIKQLEQVDQNALEKNSEAIFTLADAQKQRGKSRSALKTLNKYEALLQASDTTRYTILKAGTLATAGKIEESIEAYKSALDQSPSNIDALLGAAQSHAALNQFHDAYNYLEKLEKNAPEEPKVILFKAKLALKDGNLDKAEALLTDALANLPNTDMMTPLKSNVMGALAEILTQQGRSSEALIYTRLLADAFPGAQTHQSMYSNAISLFKENKLDEAEKLLLELLEEAPSHEKAKQVLGVINYSQGDLPSAEKYFSGNIDPEITDDATTRVFALTNLRLNKPQEVLALLEEDIESSDNAETLALYGLAALSAGEDNKGVKAINRAIKIAPENAGLHLMLARYYNSASPPNTTEAEYHALAAFNKKPAEPAFQKALLAQYIASNKMGEANTLVARIVKDYPQNDKSFIFAGAHALQVRDHKRALQYFARAGELNKDNTFALIGKAQAAVALQKWEVAETAYKDLILADPDNMHAYEGLLQVKAKTGQLASAVKYLGSKTKDKKSANAASVTLAKYYSETSDLPAINILAQNLSQSKNLSGKTATAYSDIKYYTAITALNLKDLNGAREAAMEGLKYSADNKLLLTTLVNTEIADKRYAEAAKVIAQIEVSNKAIADHLAGDLHTAKGDKSAALTAYQNAWAQKPSDFLGQKLFARLNEQSRTQAHDFVNTWLSALPNSPYALMSKSGIELGKKDYQRAAKTLEQVVKIAPENVTALNNLAWIYNETGNNKALKFAEKAAALAPSSPQVLDTYGWTLYKQGKKREARKILAQALALAPDNKEIKQHLRDAQK